MPTRNTTALWEGSLKDGKGSFRAEASGLQGKYSFASRFEQGQGSNPEELIGAALAGCFSMAFTAGLEREGYQPIRITTTSAVTIEKSPGNEYAITRIQLATEAEIPKIDQDTFHKLAQTTKSDCPVSKALKGTEISLQAELKPAG